MSVRKRQIFTAMQVVVNAATKVYAANGVNKVWECYVAGICPTNQTQDFRTVISWKNGEPKIIWEPDLNDGDARTRRWRQAQKNAPAANCPPGLGSQR